MISENNPILTEIFETLYTFNADEIARQRSQAREEYIAHEKAVNNRLAKLSEENAELVSKMQALTAEKQTMEDEIERLHTKLAKCENAPDTG